MSQVKISQASPPQFEIELEEGGSHSVDPLETLNALRRAGVYDDEGKVVASDDTTIVAASRDAFGLPEITFTNALIVFYAFHEWMTGEFQKKMGWSKT